MSSYLHIVVIVWLAIIPATSGNPGGAPESACVNMSPSHGDGVTAQLDSNPYTLEVVEGHHVSKGGTLKVCVMGKNTFKGILLQMRAEGSTTPVGAFDGTRGILANDTKLMKCTADNDTVTHSKPTLKAANTTCFVWKAPDNVKQDDYRFIATIVETKETYWVNVTSDTYKYNSGSHVTDKPTGGSGVASGVGFTTLAICSLLAVAARLLQ